MRRVPYRVRHGDRAAERHAKHDRTDYAERLAERVHVVAPLRQGPGLAGAGIAAAISAMVQEDDLRDVGQGREPRLVDRVVKAGPAVQEDQRRLLPQGATLRHETGTLDIKKESHTID